MMIILMIKTANWGKKVKKERKSLLKFIDIFLLFRLVNFVDVKYLHYC
jgi:hypothetical protein